MKESVQMEDNTIKLAKLGIALAAASYLMLSLCSANTLKYAPDDPYALPAASPSPTPTMPPSAKTNEYALNQRIMEIAKSYLGMENNSGDEQDPDRNVPNPKIQELAHYIFHDDVPSEEFMGGWCDWFVTAVLIKAGVKDITESMVGILLLNHGHFVASPIPGDVVLMPGHIAFFAAEDPSTDYIWVLGGNQEYTTGSGSRESSSSSGGSYWGGSESSPKKKSPLLVNGLAKGQPDAATTVMADQDITVHIPAPKVQRRGFSVNYAKVHRTDIQSVYRMNPSHD